MRTTWKLLNKKTKPITFLLAFTFLFLFSSFFVVFADDLQDGIEAAQRQDYKTAHRLWLPLADQGNVFAQYNLGMMYAKGLGTPKDYKEAVKWYRIAAEQGYVEAQYNLGLMYVSGLGALQDYISAHMWWNIAGSKGDKSSIKNRKLVEKKCLNYK